MAELKIKRVYEEPDKADGYRVLIDKLWPRGEKKEEVPYDFWDKEIAPSNDLREWFHENPDANWNEFRKKYVKELESSPATKELMDKIHGQKTVTLLYSSKNTTENNAVVLKDFLEKKIEK